MSFQGADIRDRGEFHYNLGNALLACGEISDAMAECRDAIRLLFKHADAHLNLALLLLLSGEVAEGSTAKCCSFNEHTAFSLSRRAQAGTYPERLLTPQRRT
jgi:tetratricopeptide (TPR) repeat protein